MTTLNQTLESNPRIWGSNINPLRNPIAPGNRIRAGNDLFLCDTGMDGKWKIYRNHGDDSCIRWIIEVEGLNSQIELQSWFAYRFED